MPIQLQRPPTDRRDAPYDARIEQKQNERRNGLSEPSASWGMTVQPLAGPSRGPSLSTPGVL